MMEAFTTHRGLIVPLDRANVDTDQIIPKQHLKSIRRTGFGEHVFSDWRYKNDGSLDPNFELNQPRYAGATLLVAGNNFGCGSSREHAVWAIQQYGFRVVIAPRVDHKESSVPGFADIFRNNSVKNGLLTIELSDAQVKGILRSIAEKEGLHATVDLEKQTLVLHSDEEQSIPFEIDPAIKQKLLLGQDDISLALAEEDKISAFESKHDAQTHSAQG